MSSNTQPELQPSAAVPTPALRPEPTPDTPLLVSIKLWVEDLAYPIGLLTLAALSSPVSQASLAPVFGAIPSAVNHTEAIVLTCILGFTLRYFFRGVPSGQVAQFTAIWAFWIPAVQYYLFPLSSMLGPRAGPALMGFLSCHTLLIPTVYAAAEALEVLELVRRYGKFHGNVLPAAIGLYHLVNVEKLFQAILPALRTTSGFFATVSLQLILASVYSTMVSYKGLLFAVPALLHVLYVNPHFDSPTTTRILNDTLHQHNWTLLERHWSYTGYLSVLENTEMHYRALRCDHSLLGGEWLLTSEREEKEGWKVNEPIYAVFEMLEAVRLMELQPQVPDPEAQALVIGLGIGTAPKAFIDHGIATTILELDHIIYYYAMEYFNLPQNHTVIIGDAAAWVAEAATTNETEAQSYDYIIHDVFTGGAEPLNLFTDSFLKNLRALLKPNGAVALNYAGQVEAPLTTLVLNTIASVFDGQCKVYRDPTPRSEQDAASTATILNNSAADIHDDDFTNMVIFCRNTPGPITFRTPTAADFLASKSRQYYLLPHPKLELPFPSSPTAALPVLMAGDEASWSAQQAESAMRHWHIMRDVLPSAVWELW